MKDVSDVQIVKDEICIGKELKFERNRTIERGRPLVR